MKEAWVRRRDGISAADVAYAVGEYHTKTAGTPELSYSLAGRLYASRSGWLLLSVPNAMIRGCFDALNEPGVELPYNGDGILNAHISVARPEEIATIPGGIDAVSERGHTFRYTLGPLRSVTPAGWDEVSKVWMIEANSPELEKFRKSYGLSPLPKQNQFKFHITVAVRKKGILQENDKSKAAA